MAYVTGTGAVITDFMDALRSFAVGQGWTVDKWDLANKLLFLTKGQCAVTMHGDTTPTVNDYYGANGAATFTVKPDHTLRLALNTSNTAALTTFWGHPGSVVLSEGDDDQVRCNGLTGPFVAWFFFADATVSDYIHAVIQIGLETYQHLSFGNVDKQGMTHNGVSYVTTAYTQWFSNVSTYISSNYYLNPSSMPSKQPWPFVRGPAWTDFGMDSGSPPIILKNSNAWPVAWGAAIIGRNGATPHFRTMLGLESWLEYASQWPNDTIGQGRLLDFLIASPPTSYSNQTPLFACPVFRSYNNSTDATLSRICYVGDFPNVRACNMTNLVPGQEITLGADTWKVFPAVRKDSEANINMIRAPNTGANGVAYKKV